MSENTPSDEMLMAYADGEASPHEAAAVEAAMASDPAVAAKVEMFHETRLAAQGAYGFEAVPQDLRASVEAMLAKAEAGSAAAADPSTNVTAIGRHRGGRVRHTFSLMAATILGIAIGVGVFFAGSETNGPVAPGTVGGVAQLAALPLEGPLGLASGSETTVGAATVRAVAAFRNGAGDLCREFEVEGAAILSGIACHRGGDWQVDFAVASAVPAADGYAPASGAEALDAYLDTIGADAPLGADDERAALQALD